MAATADLRAKPPAQPVAPPPTPVHHLLPPVLQVVALPAGEDAATHDRQRSSSHYSGGAAAAAGGIEELRVKLMGHLRDAANHLHVPQPSPPPPPPPPPLLPPTTTKPESLPTEMDFEPELKAGGAAAAAGGIEELRVKLMGHLRDAANHLHVPQPSPPPPPPPPPLLPPTTTKPESLPTEMDFEPELKASPPPPLLALPQPQANGAARPWNLGCGGAHAVLVPTLEAGAVLSGAHPEGDRGGHLCAPLSKRGLIAATWAHGRRRGGCEHPPFFPQIPSDALSSSPHSPSPFRLPRELLRRDPPPTATLPRRLVVLTSGDRLRKKGT
uniref:Uncharacterized protein n=1 Tax=Oryza meridionalis TaxID=40149 RepID=A0A0E0EET2_9ORYZ